MKKVILFLLSILTVLFFISCVATAILSIVEVVIQRTVISNIMFITLENSKKASQQTTERREAKI